MQITNMTKSTQVVVTIAVVVAALLGLGAWYYYAGAPAPTDYYQGEDDTEKPQGDVLGAEAELDATNIDQIDAELNANDADAKAFE